MNMDTKLREMIDALKMLADVQTIEVEVAKRAEPKLKDAVMASLVAGESPDGEAWAPRKRGGGRPYANAASKLTSSADGNLITLEIGSPEAFGHYGTKSHGKTRLPVRRMLPDAGAALPTSVTDAVTEAMDEYLKELTK